MQIITIYFVFQNISRDSEFKFVRSLFHNDFKRYCNVLFSLFFMYNFFFDFVLRVDSLLWTAVIKKMFEKRRSRRVKLPTSGVLNSFFIFPFFRSLSFLPLSFSLSLFRFLISFGVCSSVRCMTEARWASMRTVSVVAVVPGQEREVIYFLWCCQSILRGFSWHHFYFIARLDSFFNAVRWFFFSRRSLVHQLFLFRLFIICCYSAVFSLIFRFNFFSTSSPSN